MVDAAKAAQTLARLRAQGTDDADIEAKACEHNLFKDMWESVSAFANIGGGILLFGVDEAYSFAVAKDFPADRVTDQLVEGMGDGDMQGARISNVLWMRERSLRRHHLLAKTAAMYSPA